MVAYSKNFCYTSQTMPLCGIGSKSENIRIIYSAFYFNSKNGFTPLYSKLFKSAKVFLRLLLQIPAQLLRLLGDNRQRTISQPILSHKVENETAQLYWLKFLREEAGY